MIDTSSLDRLSAGLIEVATTLSAEIRKDLLLAVQPVIADARQRVSPYSSKAGDTIRAVPGEGDSVILQTGNADVPLAALLERGNADRPRSSPVFRHPVFGNDQVWAKQATHPYLLPALNDHNEQVSKTVSTALVEHISEKLPHDR